MTIETISNKIDNLDYTLKEMITAINKANQTTITYVIIALIAITVAVIISQIFFVKYLKKLQKQIVEQKIEIEKLKEEGQQK
ncbi:MAG: hypothetical protein IKB02_04900 [Clostridia bacterium]|nr:hypothetical protein [Clostridia bacterium]MBR6582716.1 hypothetical protein [Treponema sp.]